MHTSGEHDEKLSCGSNENKQKLANQDSVWRWIMVHEAMVLSLPIKSSKKKINKLFFRKDEKYVNLRSDGFIKFWHKRLFIEAESFFPYQKRVFAQATLPAKVFKFSPQLALFHEKLYPMQTSNGKEEKISMKMPKFTKITIKFHAQVPV